MEGGNTQKEISEAVQGFHSGISKIFKIIDAKTPGNLEIDRLKRLVRIARDEDPLNIINKCKDKLWDSRERILERDQKFFMNNTFGQYIKKDENQMFIESMINLIQTNVDNLSAKEKDYIWKIIQGLLDQVTVYKILIGDYEE